MTHIKRIGEIPNKLFFTSIFTFTAIVLTVSVIIVNINRPSSIRCELDSVVHTVGYYTAVLNTKNIDSKLLHSVIGNLKNKLILKLFFDKQDITIHKIEIIEYDKLNKLLTIRFSDKSVEGNTIKTNMRADLINREMRFLTIF